MMHKDAVHHNGVLEIMDTTLRDGEQTPGVSFTPAEKLQIARMLLGQLHVDRIEVGSARVSDGEFEGVRAIIDWAAARGDAGAVEILGFIDHGRSAEWVRNAGGKCINFLAKGSEHHCRTQLKKTPRQHYEEVAKEIRQAHEMGLQINLYLEDWSNGMRHSLDYVFGMMAHLKDFPVQRFMLADTLGVLTPEEVARYIGWMTSAFPYARLDFHGHNDYGLAAANGLAAVAAGVSGIHTTINGLGERAGNLPLAQLVTGIHDLTGYKTRVHEKMLVRSAEMIQSISGKRCSWNMPVTGEDVFTQTCGVHADGDKKGDLYCNALLPERFGCARHYALGKLSGKASIERNLDDMGMDLDPVVRAEVLQKVIQIGDRKKQIDAADLPFIIADVLNRPCDMPLKVADYRVESRAHKLPKAWVTVEYQGQVVEESSTGDGGYDAFMKALRKILRKLHISMPRLVDYQVRIPPGGKTDALVETSITWQIHGRSVVTSAVECDQLAAAIVATEKMLNTILPPVTVSGKI